MDKNALIANTATNFPDNNTGDIEPSNSRNNAEQIITACANLDELNEQEFLGPIKFSGTVTGAGAYYTEFVRSASEVTQVRRQRQCFTV